MLVNRQLSISRTLIRVYANCHGAVGGLGAVAELGGELGGELGKDRILIL